MDSTQIVLNYRELREVNILSVADSVKLMADNGVALDDLIAACATGPAEVSTDEETLFLQELSAYKLSLVR